MAKATVTFSHQRRSVASRVGALQVRAAGEGEAEEAPGRGEFDAVGPLRGGRVPPLREEGLGELAVREGEVAVAVVVVTVPAGVGPSAGTVGLPVPSVPFAPSSGTSVTDPVGRAEALGVPPAAPTAV
ncbi:hypothetical protein [Streptomyces sp. NPDC008092]|uniref:hypothetical protein n=1 Tax=Streptomyces sp. NPDC008092 TaxID=3364808 RepID=UPI0036E3AF82